MSRKPRFKVQRRNSGDLLDLSNYGQKQWLKVWDNNGNLGYTLTRQGADDLYWQMCDQAPGQTYRIMEKR